MAHRGPRGSAPEAGLVDDGADRIVSRDPMLLAAGTVFAGLAIYAYLGLYPTYLRDELGYTPEQAGLALSMYGLGALFSLVGGWLGDRLDFRRLLAVALAVSAVTGYLFQRDRLDRRPLALSLVYGAAISGVVYLNLAAGIIRSVRRQVTRSGLFVAAIYVPTVSGYLLGVFAGRFGWSPARLRSRSPGSA